MSIRRSLECPGYSFQACSLVNDSLFLMMSLLWLSMTPGCSP